MRALQNLLIAAVLVLMLGDGVPPLASWQSSLKNLLDPVVDATGLWQGSWKLFAPEVDRINIAISADIVYADGLERRWESPEWADLPFSRRFTRYREGRFVDKVRLDLNRGAWPGLARWLARAHPHPRDASVPVEVVRLYRHWAEIPPPGGAGWQPVVPLARNHDYQFHTETLP